MSPDMSITDLRFEVLLKTADSCDRLAKEFGSLENLSSQLTECNISNLIELSKDVGLALESSKCLKSSEYLQSSEKSSAVRSIANLNLHLDQCIDDPSRYSEALDILEAIDRLKEEHSQDNDFIESIFRHTGEKRDYLLVNLCNQLDDQKSAPTEQLNEIVQLLARCGQFSDRQIRLRYLLSRDHWFNSECESRSDSFDEVIIFFCHGLPKIFDEFRSIFGDSSVQAINKYAAISYDRSKKESNSIINSWLLLKASTFILSLDMHLKSLSQSRLLTPTIVEDTIKKCFKLTDWLASIGFDFSSNLRPLFLNAIKEGMKFHVERATAKFEIEFTRIVSKSIESILLPIDDEILRISNMRSEEKIPKSLEHYPVLKIYCLSLIDSLRWIRATQSLISPICLCEDVYKALNSSLSRVMQTLMVIIMNTDNNSSHPILSRISVLFLTEILPFISNYCDLIFKEKLVLGALGLSKTEFKALCLREPDSVNNLRLHPPSLESFQRHISCQTGVNL